jgi:hypothetical protein
MWINDQEYRAMCIVSGGGTIYCFHESRVLNGYLKGGYYIQFKY